MSKLSEKVKIISIYHYFCYFFAYLLQGFLCERITTNNLYYNSLQKYSPYFSFPIKNSFIEKEYIPFVNAK